MSERTSYITINCGCCGNADTGNAITNNTYSFDEVAIGTWVDGRTIYRKVIEGKLAGENGVNIEFADVSDLDIGRMINLYGNFISAVGSYTVFPITFSHPVQTVASAVNMAYRDGKLQYHYLNSGGNYSGCTAYVVLEYTKQDTTATA